MDFCKARKTQIREIIKTWCENKFLMYHQNACIYKKAYEWHSVPGILSQNRIL